ncbi:MAG: hypothetical protein J6X50_04450 [Bacilli bacterium]|nr:hypothetical protein [Bacilli bacterium]
MACGFTSAQFFYLKKKGFAIFWLILNLIILGGLFTLLFMLPGVHIAIAIIAPILATYILNSITGVIYYFLPDLKDGNGEFVV